MHVASESLMSVKEDLILANEISFADLLLKKARGESGPFFFSFLDKILKLAHQTEGWKKMNLSRKSC